MPANKKGPAIYSNNDREQGMFRRGRGLVCSCNRLTSMAALLSRQGFVIPRPGRQTAARYPGARSLSQTWRTWARVFSREPQLSMT